jgi:hypothetical protein
MVFKLTRINLSLLEFLFREYSSLYYYGQVTGTILLFKDLAIKLNSVTT